MPEPVVSHLIVGLRVRVKPGSYHACGTLHDGRLGLTVDAGQVPAKLRDTVDLKPESGPPVYVLYDDPDPLSLSQRGPWYVAHRADALEPYDDEPDPERAREESYVPDSSTDPDDLVQVKRG